MFKLSKKAFSIIEIVLAAAIFLILMGIVFKTLVTGRNIFLKSTSRSYLFSAASNAINLMASELAESNASKFRIGSPSSDLNGNNPSSSGPLIIFAVPTDTDSPGDNSPYASDGTLQWGAVNNANWRIRYRMDTVNNYLLREIIDCSGSAGAYVCNLAATADNSRIIAKKVCPVDPILFTNNGGKSITVTLNLNDSVFTSGDVKTSQNIRVKLRN